MHRGEGDFFRGWKIKIGESAFHWRESVSERLRGDWNVHQKVNLTKKKEQEEVVEKELVLTREEGVVRTYFWTQRFNK